MPRFSWDCWLNSKSHGIDQPSRKEKNECSFLAQISALFSNNESPYLIIPRLKTKKQKSLAPVNSNK